MPSRTPPLVGGIIDVLVQDEGVSGRAHCDPFIFPMAGTPFDAQTLTYTLCFVVVEKPNAIEGVRTSRK